MGSHGWIAGARRWGGESGLGGWLLVLALALHLGLDLPLGLWMTAEAAGAAAGPICGSAAPAGRDGPSLPAGHHDHQDCPLCHGATAIAWLGTTAASLPLPALRTLRQPAPLHAVAADRFADPAYRSRAPPTGLPFA